jgi:hypothetical protein
VLHLLAKSTTDRFQTAAEVAHAAERASMRAGAILSTSAVSRLVRELSGMRAEPWLDIDGAMARARHGTLHAVGSPHIARAAVAPGGPPTCSTPASSNSSLVPCLIDEERGVRALQAHTGLACEYAVAEPPESAG